MQVVHTVHQPVVGVPYFSEQIKESVLVVMHMRSAVLGHVKSCVLPMIFVTAVGVVQGMHSQEAFMLDGYQVVYCHSVAMSVAQAE